MIWETAILVPAFMTLFVVIDPIGLTPMFVALTQGMDARTRRSVALRACGVAVGILAAFSIFGEALLGFVGISMPAFRVAGGMLLFLTALEMLFERRTKRREDQTDTATDTADDPSVFPLAIPLIAGPGAIASVILLAGSRPGIEGIALATGTAAAVIAIAFVLFLASGVLERLLGKTGINVVTRVLGMLLAALSVQYVMDGLRAFLFAN